MKKTAVLGLLLFAATHSSAGEVTRHALPNNSTFPIARAVEASADSTLIWHSGTTPRPANEEAERGSPEYWGDTEAQTLSVLSRMDESFKELGVGFGDVLKMTVFLVGDPKLGGGMDFEGFMRAYSQYFGTDEQPNLPARSTVQVAGLAAEGMLVEIEVVLARPQ
ncbi:MAG TPA: RidA family protein [Woeseiaceae bacterium]|nr:RidA family protein [Woeseiaceae bacterium]